MVEPTRISKVIFPIVKHTNTEKEIEKYTKTQIQLSVLQIWIGKLEGGRPPANQRPASRQSEVAVDSRRY